MNDVIKDYCPEYPRQILNNIKQSKNGISTFAVDALFGYQNLLPENPLNLMNVFAIYNNTVIQNKSAITVNLRPDEFTDLAIWYTHPCTNWLYNVITITVIIPVNNARKKSWTYIL